MEQALGAYLTQEKDKEGQQNELARFIRWCGRQREVESLTAYEVTEYAQFASGSSADGKRRLEPVREFLAFVYKEGLHGQNLAPQVRASKGRSPRKESAPAVPMEDVTLTPEGAAQMQERLALLREERPHIVEDVRLAAADKDVRENAPLAAARERLGFLDGRIRDMDLVLRSAAAHRPREKPPEEDVASLGRRVSLRNVTTGAQLSYILVSAPEANPMGGKLSISSPVGKALLNRRVGEEVKVPTPRGTEAFHIVGVQ